MKILLILAGIVSLIAWIIGIFLQLLQEPFSMAGLLPGRTAGNHIRKRVKITNPEKEPYCEIIKL